ncbi:MAG: TolC family protein [Candidatus Obscuribacterales bacterium]|nr:TolC family protein [Candidatus Obscuribacterales bacterium]
MVTAALLSFYWLFGLRCESAESLPPPEQKLPEQTSPTGGMTTPPVLRGPVEQAMPTPQPLKGPPQAATEQAKEQLDQIVEETIKSAGAMFQDPEKVFVKAPLLTALIRLDDRLSPYQLDSTGTGSRAVNLHDMVNAAITGNLTIRISQQQSESAKWLYYGSVGGFLPNLNNEFSYQAIDGQYISPAGLALPIKNYYINMPAAFQWYLYKGGGPRYTFLQNKHNYKASQYALKGDTNDVLLETAKLYYKLVLEDAELQIRVKSVETGSALYLINQDLFANGVNTMLEVLQAKTQLSRDKQQLIKKQVSRRQSAIHLARAVNLDEGVDLTLLDRQIAKTRLVDKNLMIGDLLKIAIDNRPELKKYTELRLAAKDAIQVAKAPLLPQVSFTATTVGTFARIRPLTSTSSQQQQTSLSTSGGASVSGGVSSGASLPLATSGSGSSGTHPAGRSLFLVGLDVQWNIGGLGVTSVGNVQSARATARKIQLEFNDELNKIYAQVRDTYLSSMSAESLIVETTDAVNSSAEQLRVAKDRLENGVGTNLDVINAQRDYTSALIDKANAIIQFNTAQAQLLHDIGRISAGTLLASTPLRQ